MKVKFALVAALVMILSIVTLQIAGCGGSGGGGGGGGGTAPDDGVTSPTTAISLVAESLSLPADGVSSTTISATLTGSDGNPVSEGTEAVFSTNLGRLPGGGTTYTAKTSDGSGVIRVSLVADNQAGTATVEVKSGGISQAIKIEFTMGSIPTAISLQATAQSIPADGVSSTSITATLTTSTGAPVVAGTSVIFVTDKGTLPGGAKTFTTATSDNTGKVIISLVSETTPGIATVTASSGGVSQAIQIEFTTGTGAEPTAFIELSANPTSIPANGKSSTLIVARLYTSTADPVEAGTEVVFTTSHGRFPDDAGSPGDEKTYITRTGDEFGIVNISLISDTVPATATVTAESGGVSQIIKIEFTSDSGGGPDQGQITLSATPISMPADGASTAIIAAKLVTVTGDPAPAGTAVTFQTTLCTFPGGGQIYTASTGDDTGVLLIVLTAGNVVGTADVTAFSAGYEQGAVAVELTEVPEPGAVLALSVNPPSIPADGASSTAITATLTTAGGNSVAKGTPISFQTTLGSFPNGAQAFDTQTANDSGTVIVSLIAGIEGGTARVTANAGGISQVVEVLFRAVIPSRRKPVGEEFGVSAQFLNISGLWRSNLEDVLTFNIGDVFGNAAIDGTSLNIRTYNTGGQVNPSFEQSLNGIATTTLLSVPNPTPQEGFLAVTAETQADENYHHVTALAVTPWPDQHIMYAGTSGGGVYKSNDGGITWETASRSTLNPRQGQNWMDPFIKGKRAIAIDPDNANTVYVGTGYLGEGNIYRSLDGGLNWNSGNSEEFNGIFNIPGAVLAIVADGDENPGTDHPWVWAGTEGYGFWYSRDNGRSWGASGGVATSPQPDPGNVGNGVMSNVLASQAAPSEAWTVTALVTQPGATTPIAGTVGENGELTPNTGSGTMSDVTVSGNTVTEAWTVKYLTGVVNLAAGPGNTGNGNVTDRAVADPKINQVWTLTCTDATDPATFSVVGSVSGLQTSATVGTAYDNGQIQFRIIAGPTPFAVGDTFSLTVTDAWSVSGSVSGLQAANAFTGVPYTSDDNEVAFTISDGLIPFASGDGFFFTTSGTETIWSVSGSVSGFQALAAFNNRFYRSDSGEIQFVIFEGSTPFATGDTFTFSVSQSVINHGRTVWDMVKVDGTHGETAILYAGTSSGVFKTVNGGLTWSELANFTGDAIFSLALGPGADGGSSDIIYAGTQNGGFWMSTDSGVTWARQVDGIASGLSVAVRDILPVIDSADDNYFLYITTILQVSDAGEVTKTGALYVHELNPDGTLKADAEWVESEQGLSEAKPLYVLGTDRRENPSMIFTGGEGIGFYRANTGLGSGSPEWVESKTGLSNLIMARMPILFSGVCTLGYQLYQLGPNSYYFIVYYEDINGNPPVTGSTITISLVPGQGSESQPITYYDIDYLDSYTHQGTFRDPSDAATDWPYAGVVVFDPGSGDKLVISATSPDAVDTAPGSSGADQTITILLD